MRSANHTIAAGCAELATTIPGSVIEAVANCITMVLPGNWPALHEAVIACASSPSQRNTLSGFLETWRAKAATVSPQAVATALLTGAIVERSFRAKTFNELVWTGPEVGIIPLRRTEQALLQLIEVATQRLLIVSYAVYKIQRISEALMRAADRGVEIRIVVESPNRLEVKNTYNTLAALGSSVSNRCSIYLWPLELRATDESGKPGILHVKCAVADGRQLFLSSANLTEYAFTLNMELGVVITGENLPAQVEAHFNRMIQSGVLSKVSD